MDPIVVTTPVAPIVIFDAKVVGPKVPTDVVLIAGALLPSVLTVPFTMIFVPLMICLVYGISRPFSIT